VQKAAAAALSVVMRSYYAAGHSHSSYNDTEVAVAADHITSTLDSLTASNRRHRSSSTTLLQ